MIKKIVNLPHLEQNTTNRPIIATIGTLYYISENTMIGAVGVQWKQSVGAIV